MNEMSILIKNNTNDIVTDLKLLKELRRILRINVCERVVTINITISAHWEHGMTSNVYRDIDCDTKINNEEERFRNEMNEKILIFTKLCDQFARKHKVDSVHFFDYC